jgi:hypothetical protein
MKGCFWFASNMGNVDTQKKYALMLKILIRKKQKKMACQAMLWDLICNFMYFTKPLLKSLSCVS